MFKGDALACTKAPLRVIHLGATTDLEFVKGFATFLSKNTLKELKITGFRNCIDTLKDKSSKVEVKMRMISTIVNCTSLEMLDFSIFNHGRKEELGKKGSTKYNQYVDVEVLQEISEKLPLNKQLKVINLGGLCLKENQCEVVDRMLSEIPSLQEVSFGSFSMGESLELNFLSTCRLTKLTVDSGISFSACVSLRNYLADDQCR